MSIALRRGLNKAIRTVFQLLVSGGFTVMVNEFASGLSPGGKLGVAGGFLVLTTFAQNSLETAGTIPVLLPSPAMSVTPPPAAGPLLAQVQPANTTAVDPAGTTYAGSGPWGSEWGSGKPPTGMSE